MQRPLTEVAGVEVDGAAFARQHHDGVLPSFRGSPSAALADPVVRAAYLGTHDTGAQTPTDESKPVVGP